MTIGETMAATFDGVNAEAAHRRAPNAGSIIAVPLFLSGGSPFAENVYHPVGINGGSLANDLRSALVHAVTTIPIANIDFRILHDIGTLVGLPCYIKGERTKSSRGDVAAQDLTPGHCLIHRAGWYQNAVGAFAPELPGRDLCVSPGHTNNRDNADSA
jgi:hypothetical protein